MVLNVNAANVTTSAVIEDGISAAVAAAASAAAGSLTTVMPMGVDLDSVQFAAALNAAGATYLGTASEHLASRSAFAGAQKLAAATYTATDVISNAALAL